MWHEVIHSWTTVWRNLVSSWRHIIAAHLVYTGLGVDGIITDEPALAREVLADRNELNSVERLLVQIAYLMGWQIPVGTYRDNSP